MPEGNRKKLTGNRHGPSKENETNNNSFKHIFFLRSNQFVMYAFFLCFIKGREGKKLGWGSGMECEV